MRGRADFVKALITAGADVNARDKDGKSALAWAWANLQHNKNRTFACAGQKPNPLTPFPRKEGGTGSLTRTTSPSFLGKGPGVRFPKR